MADTRITQPGKLNTLPVITHTGHGLGPMPCATAIMGNKPISLPAHGYRAKSWFRLGFDQLRKWILHQPDRAAQLRQRIWPKRKPTLQSQRVV